MKKRSCCLLCLVLICVLALPALAAGAEPKITLQPQNYHYPEYSVAIYTVKAEGQNLRATWYLEYEDKTYCLSDNQNGFEPWEAYAGENYGPMEEGPNTFSWFFGGIEEGLNGAEIWCVLEDGHYDVTSSRAIITVQGDAMPPEILQLPASLTVFRGDETEVRCVARSGSDAQLSFQWYETATGKLQDIRAIEGEDCDFLVCSTENIGTRYYVCCVTGTDGGRVYSSVLPVTVLDYDPEPPGVPPTLVTKKLPQGKVGEDYGFTLESDDYAAEFSVAYNPGGSNDFDKTGLKLSVEGFLMGQLKAAGTYTFTVCVANQYGEGYGELTLEVVDPTSQEAAPTTTPTTTPETTSETIPETTPASTSATPQASTPTATQPQPQVPEDTAGFPWWGYLLIVLGGITTGIGIAFIFTKLKS